MDGVFELSKFLAAGTLVFSLNSVRDVVDDAREPADDGWTTFSDDVLVDSDARRTRGDSDSDFPMTSGSSSSSSSYSSFGAPNGDTDATREIESLRFLVRNRFVAATYLLSHALDAAHTHMPEHGHEHEHAQRVLLFVRVYIVPWDLPGSRGVLRNRDEDSVLRPGRRRLKALFLRIRQDAVLWQGIPDAASGSTSTPEYFWENVVVSRRSAIFMQCDGTSVTCADTASVR